MSSRKNKERDEDDIEKIYQKKTQLEHILLRPDTYVGSIEHYQQYLWVYDLQLEKIIYKQITYVPGLYKIFVNAADNYQNDKSQNLIKVEIDPEQNKIQVWNNGKGIPVQIHKVHNCYVPDMIFGQLLTSSNYDDNKKKVTGGRNGFGAKLANIFSTKFIVETADSKSGLVYKQVWKNNMSVREEPVIKPIGKNQEDFTCVTFYPDLKRFNMTNLDEDIVSLMNKRVYDIAGTTPAQVKVKLNGKNIDVKNFINYCDYYLQTEENKTLPKIIEKVDPTSRWEVVVSHSDGQFQQVSFVNSICTIKGGSHVNYIADQIVDKIQEVLKKKHKSVEIKPHQIKSNLWVFVNCLIENPAFDSQTKETLTTKPVNFGSTCTLSEKFLKQVLESGIIESIVSVAKAKEEAKLARNLNVGKKKAKLMGIPKLEDANLAGTRNAQNCTIILTEGDSAKSLALAGIEVVGRDHYGVFPLRGKFLNVREATNKQIQENAEIAHLIKILGLKVGKVYEDLNDLRYGSIMIMTDQDHDGSHIKGLLINFIHHFWPSLMKYNGFLKEFVTPIIKATKGNEVLSFFTIPEYERWAEGQNLKGWKIKYYKGLGTSTAKEAKEYFSQIDTHQIEFEYIDREDEEVIDLAFNKKLADKRKDWLTTYRQEQFVDHSQPLLRYKDFVNKELILFSIADCQRSIPSLCDGLKPGQRKILFCCFKRKLRDEIKVAQLVGYVGENSAYHHGEQSLCQTIITMAQNFVGSNNINLLLPIGQFGTRNQGGKEAASPRYIFTNLSPVTRAIFHPDDDAVLNYLEEEGQSIEPDYYLPILPMSLINGAEGIGTGWSTFIPCHNPRDIVANLRRMMKKEEYEQMHPWYKGFSGTIEQQGARSYLVRGNYEINQDGDLEITELPVGKWTRDYKSFLEELADPKNGEIVDDIRELHTENRVHFIVRVNNLDKIVAGEGIEKKFKLTTSISTNNYVLFDFQNNIKRYNSEQEIMQEFFVLREQLYHRRKEYLLAKLKKELVLIENKVRFILAIVNDEITINKVKKKIIVAKLKQMGFKTMSEINEILPEKKKLTLKQEDGEEEKAIEEEQVAPGEIPSREYDYLLTMSLMSLTEERVEDLQKQLKEKRAEYERLEAMHIYDIWNNDLQNFLDVLEDHEAREEEDRLAHGVNNGGAKKKGRAKPRKAIAADKDKKAPAKVKDEKAAQQKPGGGKQTSMQDFVKKSKQQENQPPPDESQMTLMQRINMRKEQNPTYPTTTVLKDMAANEREAIQNGSRKRKAPSNSSSKHGSARNMQRKRAANGNAVKVAKDESDDDDFIAKMMAQRRNNNRQRQKAIVDDSDVESEEDDDDSAFEADEYSI